MAWIDTKDILPIVVEVHLGLIGEDSYYGRGCKLKNTYAEVRSNLYDSVYDLIYSHKENGNSAPIIGVGTAYIEQVGYNQEINNFEFGVDNNIGQAYIKGEIPMDVFGKYTFYLGFVGDELVSKQLLWNPSYVILKSSDYNAGVFTIDGIDGGFDNFLDFRDWIFKVYNPFSGWIFTERFFHSEGDDFNNSFGFMQELTRCNKLPLPIFQIYSKGESSLLTIEYIGIDGSDVKSSHLNIVFKDSRTSGFRIRVYSDGTADVQERFN